MEKDVKLFIELSKYSQKELKEVLFYYLKKKYKKVNQTKDYIYAVGEIPVALVAHLDTVFAIPPQKFYYDKEQETLWSPDGLGADDRAGVTAIIQIIKSGLRPHIIFTTDEEKGALGASALGGIPCPFKDLRYIIELDRNGEDDCVFYSCDNREFVDYVKSFGFQEALGSFSDISAICPAWKIAGVNLSIGYQYEHSHSELLNFKNLRNTISKVKIMLTQFNIPQFKYVEKQYYYYGSDYICSNCGLPTFKDEVFVIRDKHQHSKYWCLDCVVSKGEWCQKCGKLFIKSSPADTLCDECRKEK